MVAEPIRPVSDNLAADELVVDFSATGNSAGWRTSGWSVGEPTEVWTLGHETRLMMPAPTRAATYVMVLTVRPLVAGARLPSQRLRVSANGQHLADFVIEERAVRTCRVPWSAIAGKSLLRIGFHLPDAACPADLGLNEDFRQLGVAFSELRLYPEPETPPPQPIGDPDRMALPELLLRFESLGQSCEFGLVQRQCRAEPLGLLRFASSPLPILLAALDARFAGMGSPDCTTAELSESGREYMVRDACFGFLYHAWVDAGAMPPEQIVAREARRVPLLVRKLLEDLAEGEKIFVFNGMGRVAEDAAMPLAEAIRRHGPNHLLFVRLADAANRAGTAALRTPGFIVGYLDRFAPSEDAHDLRLSQWIEVCREAWRLRLGAQPASA